MPSQVGAAILWLILAGEPGTASDQQDAGATLFIVVDRSESIDKTQDTKLRAALRSASDGGFQFKCVAHPIHVAFFGGRASKGQANTAGLCSPDGGEVNWELDALPKEVEGLNTPIGKALMQALQKPSPAGSKRLLFFVTDGRAECDARTKLRGTDAGELMAHDFALRALARIRGGGAFERTWFVQVKTESAQGSGLNIFDNPGPLFPLGKNERHVVVDAGPEFNLAELVNRETERWCLYSEPAAPRCTEDSPEAALVGNGDSFRCTGVAVGPRTVLTAAHCLPATMIGFGATAAQAIRFPIVSTLRAPNGIDAALVVSDRDLPQSRIRRIFVSGAPPSGPLLHVGYGAKDGVEFGKRRTTTASARGWGCIDTALRRTGCEPEKEMYLEGSPGHDTCLGDSGGPVWQRMGLGECVEDGAEVQSRWRLVGITSRSADGATAQCGQGSVVTRADLLMPWLNETPELFLREP